MQLQTGVRGATVQSWHPGNPRSLLKQLIEENGPQDKAALLRALRDAVLADDGEDYLAAIIEYWFSNNYHSLVDSVAGAGRGSAAASRARRDAEQVKAKIEAQIVEKARILLMDMLLPNGKALRDCTGDDCARLAPRLGQWLGEVGRKVGPNETVGAVLSEADVQQLYECAQAE